MGTTKKMDLFERESPRINARHYVLLRAPGLMAPGSLATVSLGQSMPAWTQTQSGSVKNDVSILNMALGLEYQAIAAYRAGAENGLLQKPVLATAVKFQSHHEAHASVLAGTVSELGGTPIMEKKVAEYNFSVSQLKTQADVLRFAAGLEESAASAYSEMIPSFYTRDLARIAANILGDETIC